MFKKPTYEELEKRVELLEKEAAKRKGADNELRKYQFMIESARDAIFFKDLDSRYIIANDKTIETFGLPREDVIGKNDYELMADQQEARKNVDDDQIIFQSGKPTDISKHMTGADGKEYWFQAIKVPQLDNDGKVAGLVGIARDITGRRQVEEALRESEGKLNATLLSIGDHMSMMDKDLNIIWANSVAKNIFGDDIVGKKCHEAYHQRKEPCEPYPCITLKAFMDGGTHTHNTQVIDKNGKILSFHCTASVALKDKAGKPETVIEISRDVTKHRQAEEALQKAHAELEQRVEKRTVELLKTNERLKESEEHFRKLAEGAFEAIVLHKEGVILVANDQYYKMFGYTPEELAGKDAILSTTTPESAKNIREHILAGNLGPYEATGLKKDGTKFPIKVRIKLTRYMGNEVRIAVIRDLTEREQRKAALKKRTNDLKQKTIRLKEINTAMKVLLNKRAGDKTDLEDNVLSNVKALIVPYLDKINKTGLDDHQKVFLNILQSNLNEIISPFTRRLSLEYLSLTPKEIQIANLIKHGSTSKQIADIMNISPRTVDTHRKNIRKKIGLEKKRANLRSHLLALQ